MWKIIVYYSYYWHIQLWPLKAQGRRGRGSFRLFFFFRLLISIIGTFRFVIRKRSFLEGRLYIPRNTGLQEILES